MHQTRPFFSLLILSLHMDGKQYNNLRYFTLLCGQAHIPWQVYNRASSSRNKHLINGISESQDPVLQDYHTQAFILLLWCYTKMQWYLYLHRDLYHHLHFCYIFICILLPCMTLWQNCSSFDVVTIPRMWRECPNLLWSMLLLSLAFSAWGLVEIDQDGILYGQTEWNKYRLCIGSCASVLYCVHIIVFICIPV